MYNICLVKDHSCSLPIRIPPILNPPPPSACSQSDIKCLLSNVYKLKLIRLTDIVFIMHCNCTAAKHTVNVHLGVKCNIYYLLSIYRLLITTIMLNQNSIFLYYKYAPRMLSDIKGIENLLFCLTINLPINMHKP